MAAWQPAGQVAALAGLFQQPPPLPPTGAAAASPAS
jgi:hypothetical protein